MPNYSNIGRLTFGIGSGLFITGAIFGLFFGGQLKNSKDQNAGLLKTALFYGINGMMIPFTETLEFLDVN
jgi:hypothetical protein